ncbi:MAG: hypothetical protein EB127_24640 [Alphaproteobacteria bacterium]|nr:hypothetical protein [Alphaproteobacteria bacterium]
MFHPSQLEMAKQRIIMDLQGIEYYRSIKLYLCWYDNFLIPDEDYKGIYPCSDNSVDLKEVIDIVAEALKRPHIIRHNVLVSPIPAALVSLKELDVERYIEVCLVN